MADDYYNQIAEGYVELHGSEQKNKIRIIRENLDIRPEHTVLDLGCGPGLGWFAGKIIGLDPSIGLLRQADIAKVLGIAEHLPFKDDSFTTVISLTAIQHFEDIDKALCEAKRVCKGQFAFSFQRKSPRAKEFSDKLREHLDVYLEIEEDKDLILIAKYK